MKLYIILISIFIISSYIVINNTVQLYDIIPIYPIKSNYTYYIDYTNYRNDTSINSTDINNAFNLWSDLNNNINFKYTDKRSADIIIQFDDHHPSYNAGMTLCIFEKCTITIYQGALDCNDKYHPLSKTLLNGTIQHEIGHTMGIQHNDIKGHMMYSTINIIDDYNPRNITIPIREQYFAVFGIEEQIYLDVINILYNNNTIPDSYRDTISCLRDPSNIQNIDTYYTDIIKHNLDIILNRL